MVGGGRPTIGANEEFTSLDVDQAVRLVQDAGGSVSDDEIGAGTSLGERAGVAAWNVPSMKPVWKPLGVVCMILMDGFPKPSTGECEFHSGHPPKIWRSSRIVDALTVRTGLHCRSLRFSRLSLLAPPSMGGPTVIASK